MGFSFHKYEQTDILADLRRYIVFIQHYYQENINIHKKLQVIIAIEQSVENPENKMPRLAGRPRHSCVPRCIKPCYLA